MPQERTFRSEAIILSRTDFGEADRLLVIFTPRHGKQRAIAKGARKPAARKSGHVELFARTDLLLHRGRDLLIVSQAEMTEPYLPLREDLTRTAYANHAAELLDRFTTDEDEAESAALFDLLDVTLRRLCGESDLRIAARFYEMRLLDLAGFRPELARCALGGEAIQPEDQFFSVREGGVICPSCGGPLPEEAAMPISRYGLHALRALQRESWERVQALKLNEPLHLEIERVMLGYLVALLEKRLQSVDFIRRLRIEGAGTPAASAPPPQPSSHPAPTDL
jgi:DNA repair protein RecO (recombination protein O)